MKKFIISFMLMISCFSSTFLCLNVCAEHGGGGSTRGEETYYDTNDFSVPSGYNYIVTVLTPKSSDFLINRRQTVFCKEVPSIVRSLSALGFQYRLSFGDDPVFIVRYDDTLGDEIFKFDGTTTDPSVARAYFDINLPSNYSRVLSMNFIPNIPEGLKDDIPDGFFDGYLTDKSYLGTPLLEVTSFEYINTGMSSFVDKASGCYDMIRLKIKNNTVDELKVSFTLDTKSYSDTPNIKLQSSEHLTDCFFKIPGTAYDELGTVLLPKKESTVVLNLAGMPYHNTYYFNAWTTFEVSDTHTSSGGGIHGGGGSVRDGDSASSEEISSYANKWSYACFYSKFVDLNALGVNEWDYDLGDVQNIDDLEILPGYEPGDIPSDFDIDVFNKSFYQNLTDIQKMSGNYFNFLKQAFVFLPSEFWSIIFLGIGLIVLLRVLGR